MAPRSRSTKEIGLAAKMIEIVVKMIAARMRYFQKQKERVEFALDGQ